MDGSCPEMETKFTDYSAADRREKVGKFHKMRAITVKRTKEKDQLSGAPPPVEATGCPCSGISCAAPRQYRLIETRGKFSQMFCYEDIQS